MTKTSTKILRAEPVAVSCEAALELACPADTLVMLRVAVDSGADWVRLRYQCPGDFVRMTTGVRYAHDKGCKILLAVDMFDASSDWRDRRDAVDRAAAAGVDALLACDPAMMLYAAMHYPELRLHFPASAASANTESVNFLRRQFGIARVLMPRVQSLARLEQIAKDAPIEFAVYGFGKGCVLVERSLGTDASPGAERRRDGTGLYRCADSEDAANESYYSMQDSPSANTLKLLPRLMTIGVRTVFVEAHGCSPARASEIIRVWREAIDNCLEDLSRYTVKPSWVIALNRTARKFCA